VGVELLRTRAVVLAGGRGTRLAPYTSVLPKPLMPIGDHAILELVIDQLAGFGVRHITLCVGHLSHLIRAVLDDGADRGVRIDYVQESEPLGTVAPLHLVDGLVETYIVMNGDVLTTLDYGDLLRHHRESGNLLTVATHRRAIRIDYGVIYTEGGGPYPRIKGYEEKPEVVSLVSMGIYAMEPAVLAHVPGTGRFDFPDLVHALIRANEPVGAYLFDGLWFDIGRQEDYERAVDAWSAASNTAERPAGAALRGASAA
jgi:NDP-mannose synthase